MHGRAGELKKLYEDMNNPDLPAIVRERADHAMRKIREQMEDKKLMNMREQLIRATRAGDSAAARRIELRMREYSGEDRETGT